jgi:hypothetical protein
MKVKKRTKQINQDAKVELVQVLKISINNL